MLLLGACVAGRVSAGTADIVAIGFGEVYATQPTLDRLVAEYASTANVDDVDTNVHARNIPDNAAFLLDGRTRMPAAVVAVGSTVDSDVGGSNRAQGRGVRFEPTQM